MTIFSKDHPSPHGEISRWVKIRTNFIGFHAYKDAPEKVAFLKSSHRHRFYVEASIQVFHDDRELEFFMVQDILDRDIIPFLFLKPLGSCEMIAEHILWGLVNTYGDHRNYYIEVSEDNENSGTVSWSSHSVSNRTTGFGQDDIRYASEQEFKRAAH